MGEATASDVTAEVTGLVLAGGRSTRMGGRDKATYLLAGRPMIEWIAARLRPQVGKLLVNSSNGALASCGDGLVPDAIGDRPGPLAGIHAGLLACRTPLLVCVPCDGPLLPTDLVQRLHAALDGADIAVASTSAGRQPTYLLCRASVADSIKDFLASGRHAVHAWLDEQHCVEVAFTDESAFGNVNTPEDASRIASQLAP